MPTTSVFYPFISAQAKTSYDEVLGAKHPVKERPLDLDHPQTDTSIKDIIHVLGWDNFCKKPDEGVLQIVKEFYANLEDRVEDKVFVRGTWVPIDSEELNQRRGTPEYLEDEYSVMMESDVSKEELEQQLCSPERDIIWTKGKHNQLLSFNTGALLPQWTPLFKFICSRLIPTTHTSNVTKDRATLLLAMIQKKQVDAGWIIYNNIMESSGPTKGLWFPALITKLCLRAGVKVQKGEERVKAGLAISAKTSIEVPVFGGQRTTMKMLEELHAIRATQNQLLEFQKYQHNWNQAMEKIWSDSINVPNVPTFVAGLASVSKTKPKAKSQAKHPKATRHPATTTSSASSEEEEAATHLGGDEPLTGHFTRTNSSSTDESS